MRNVCLLEGKYNISEVAFKVGINSTVYFVSVLKMNWYGSF